MVEVHPAPPVELLKSLARVCEEEGEEEPAWNAVHGFSFLTLFTLLALVALVVWGAVDSERPRAPSISAMIADDFRKLVLYGVVVCAFVLSRTGLVFSSTFHDWNTPRCFCCRSARYLPSLTTVVVFCGCMQLSGFILVGMTSLNLYPTAHYVFAGVFAVFFGSVCEGLLLYRRWHAQRLEKKGEILQMRDWWANLFVYLGMILCLTIYGGITFFDDYYAEINTYVGVAEWYGFMLMILINVFRQDDVVRVMRCSKKSCCGDPRLV